MSAPNTARRKAAGRLAAAVRHGNPALAADARAELAKAQRDYLIDQLVELPGAPTRDQLDRLADLVAGEKCAA
jgi:hypothetical protein